MDWFELLAYVDGTISAVYTFFLQWVAILVAAINVLADAISKQGAGNSTLSSSLFGSVGKFFDNFWNHYLKKAISFLLLHIQHLYDKLSKILGSLTKWLQKVRKWYDTHILKMLQQQLQLIQQLRQFLALLRIFHVKWAQTLDQYLLDLQSKITGTIELVRGTLNLIISWISLVTDPSLIIRRNTLGAWLLSHLGGLKRIVGYGDGRPLTSVEQAAIDKARNRYTSANVQAHLHTLTLTGLTDDDMAEREVARTALAEATGAPLPF